MPACFFVSDLHGDSSRYQKLFRAILDERPAAVFLGGDLLPMERFPLQSEDIRITDFVHSLLGASFEKLNNRLGNDYPRIFIILGNDDPRSMEKEFIYWETRGIWEYISNRRVQFDHFFVYGYGYVPPTPFLLKDWERYDVSRFVDPGCISPEDGLHSIPETQNVIRFSTIQTDLERLSGEDNQSNAIYLLHSPPYHTPLDQAELEGKMVEDAPLDIHVGSIAVKRFVETHQPLISLHGHVHESARLSGTWRVLIGRTYSFSAAHDGSELALVRFDPETPETATRDLI